MVKIVLNDKSIRRAPPEQGQIELSDIYLPSFGLRISAGGARTYYVMRRVKGKMVRRTIGKAPPPYVHPGERLAEGEYWPAEARERARLVLSELARGLDEGGIKLASERSAEAARAAVALAAEEAAKKSFSAVVEGFFADTSRRGGATLRSRGELERKVKVDLAGWADRQIDSITKAEIKALIRRKAETAPIAANRLLAFVHRLMRWAQREDLLTINPASEVDAPGTEKERERVLSIDELGEVWRACGSLGYPFGPLIRLLMLTAQRRGEVAGMRWSEIDGENWKLPSERAKRGKGHHVPLTPLALKVLGDLPRMGERSDLVFSTGRRRNAAGNLEPVPVAGWSRAKQRIDLIIAENRAIDADEPLDLAHHSMTAWTMHDIRRSVVTHLRDPAVTHGL